MSLTAMHKSGIKLLDKEYNNEVIFENSINFFLCNRFTILSYITKAYLFSIVDQKLNNNKKIFYLDLNKYKQPNENIFKIPNLIYYKVDSYCVQSLYSRLEQLKQIDNIGFLIIENFGALLKSKEGQFPYSIEQIFCNIYKIKRELGITIYISNYDKEVEITSKNSYLFNGLYNVVLDYADLMVFSYLNETSTKRIHHIYKNRHGKIGIYDEKIPTNTVQNTN